jgi:hypothetical protein
MDAGDFAKTWHQMHTEKFKLCNRRTDLETELVELRNQISHLDEVMSHLAPLAGLGYANEEDFSHLGITDAVRSVIKHSDDRVSAQDVRRLLGEKGYDLSGLSAPMASIYKILSRLVDDEVEREKEEGRVYYRWKHPPPITDEDIPF